MEGVCKNALFTLSDIAVQFMVHLATTLKRFWEQYCRKYTLIVRYFFKH